MPSSAVVQVAPLPPALAAALGDRYGASVVPGPGEAGRLEALAALGDTARVAVTTARFGIDAAAMAAMPGLEAVVSFGVGLDALDLEEAARRGVVVSSTPDVLTDAVADTAVGLVVSALRRLPEADRFVREGRWADGATFPLTRQLTGRTVGIVGLGRIGTAVAERLAGFRCPIAYHNRRPVPGSPFTYHDSVIGLAAAVDVLVVAAPGGSGVLVGADVLDALGPEGVLVNVGRGSVVDEAALAEALRGGRLGGAGLDVFVDEPRVPRGLVDVEGVVLTPHVGSATRETRDAMTALALDNVASFLAQGRLVTPVPTP